MSRLTQADAVVLSLLLERPMHGYELGQTYERFEVRDWAAVSRAQIYYALDKLRGAGLLAPLEETPADPRGKTVLAVTPEGERALADALASDDWATGRRPQPFATWLGLSIHARLDARERIIDARRNFLRAEIAREEASLAELATVASPRVAVGRKTIELALLQLRAELAWIEAGGAVMNER